MYVGCAVRLTEIYMAEPLIPEPSSFKMENSSAKMKRHY
jgi:hypothetical protein